MLRITMTELYFTMLCVVQNCDVVVTYDSLDIFTYQRELTFYIFRDGHDQKGDMLNLTLYTHRG